VGLVVLGQCKPGTEVLLEHGGGLDGGEESGINGLLVLLPLVRHDSGLAVSVEEFLLVLSVGLAGVLEVVIVDIGGDRHLGDVNLGGGGNNVSLVDALEGDSVDLEGAGDEEEAGLKDLEDDSPLSTEAAGEEDHDGPGGDGGTGLGGVLGLAGLLGHSDIVSRVEPGSLSSGSGGLGGLLGSTGKNKGASHYYTILDTEGGGEEVRMEGLGMSSLKGGGWACL
jgi:hypothetical protein